MGEVQVGADNEDVGGPVAPAAVAAVAFTDPVAPWVARGDVLILLFEMQLVLKTDGSAGRGVLLATT